ncbi:MAG: MJ1255/VC2487 family glycosyltransferase [Aestuariibacter sp.]
MTLRIMYGVQGTGNGHITRARVMAKAFAQRQDIEVDYLFSGRDADKYFDMDVFADYQTRDGLTFVHCDGAVSPIKTLSRARPLKFLRDVSALDLSRYDLVLNDFEPVTAWAAARQGVPSISISHQAAYSHPVPKAGQSLLDKIILRKFAPTDIQLGVHWYHFGKSIMPPFIEVQNGSAPLGKHYLVYLPFESISDIRALLDSFSEVNFECYHPDVVNDMDEGHLKWRKTSKIRFQQSLQRCAGVIANGGFELSSECLQLGKKLLIKPLHGQFEQLSNAKTLQALDLCQVMMTLNVDAIESFIDVPQPEAVTFPSNPTLLIDWLVAKNWHDTESVLSQLWQQVMFPERVKRKLQQLAG